MHATSLREAQQHRSELVLKLSTEGELLILDANLPVAKLSSVSPVSPQHSLRDHPPSSVGAGLQPDPAPEDDLLAEMLPASR
ncbi:MAG: hypothetical protein ABMA26_25500 [Limisphaerales bacterium]